MKKVNLWFPHDTRQVGTTKAIFTNLVPQVSFSIIMYNVPLNLILITKAFTETLLKSFTPFKDLSRPTIPRFGLGHRRCKLSLCRLSR